MKHFSHYSDVHGDSGRVVAIGNFDGVHRGHQMLLNTVRRIGQAQKLSPAVLTFEPHPVRILAPHIGVQRITSADERLALLAFYGIDATLAQTFDKSFAKLSPRAFVKKVLVDGLNARHVVVGYDFGFGAARSGTTETLINLGKEFGFTTEVISAQADDDGTVISSSRIRKLIASGHMMESARLLGRPFHVKGTVVQGDQRGRTIGFPTANVTWEQDIELGTGVYCGWLDFGDGPVSAVINLGHQPTFGDDRTLALEVHARCADVPNLYGRAVRVWFHKKLRSERKFDGVDALVEHLRNDVKEADKTLQNHTLPPILPWHFDSL